MKRYQTWSIGLACLAFLVLITLGQLTWHNFGRGLGSIAQAQTPKPTAQATPKPAAPAAPTPSTPPLSGSPVLQPLPPLPTPAAPNSILPSAPPLTAPPLPLSGEYQDVEGRFKIGILQGYTVSPLAGSVLIEAPDGNLAYTVVSQSQGQLGLDGNFITGEVLAEIAQATFQKGEGFQPSTPMAMPNGIYLEWTGSLTIAGKSQPVGGVILGRQSQANLLLVMIASTQAGAGQMPGAIRALVDSLQAP